MKKNKKGAALILTLYMLVIISIFISLIFLSAKNDINLSKAIGQESHYNQYLKEALDITISPILMGDGTRIVAPNDMRNMIRRNDQIDEFIFHFKRFPNVNIPQNNVDLMIARDNTDPDERTDPLLLIINIARKVEPGSPMWAISQVQIDADYARRRPVESVPRYKLNITTVIARINDMHPEIRNFTETVTRNINNIIWQGRAKAEIIQRTPFSLAQNSALFIKYAGLWVPFGANPFNQSLLNEGIDRCVGITEGYDILGDLATPGAQQNENFLTAFELQRNPNAASGVTTIWLQDNNQPLQSQPLIRGNSSTGYVGITPNLNPDPNQPPNPMIGINNQEYSIRTNIFSTTPDGQTTRSNIIGRIPAEGNREGVINLDSMRGDININIRIQNNRARVVGETQNGQRLNPPAGGLIEIVWPAQQDENGNITLAQINNNSNDTNRQILNSYPPGYANVYIVPEGNQLRMFAVGKYSGLRVPVQELLNNINGLPNNGVNIDQRQQEIVIDLNRLTNQERTTLACINVEGGNVIIMPSQNGNSTIPDNLNLTITATRFRNNDILNNRDFYQNFSNQQGIDRRIGGWDNIQQPQNFTVNLANPNQEGMRYVLPGNDVDGFDRRRQVVRALEGNIILQDFFDANTNGIMDNERWGYVGFNTSQIQNNNVPLNPPLEGGNFNIISHNFVILNYQFEPDNPNRPRYRSPIPNDPLNGTPMRAGLRGNIISYRGSLQIIDEDSYRFLLDQGRFRREEVFGNPQNGTTGFLDRITKNDNLYFFGKYIGNFANIEGILLTDGNIRGFASTVIDSSGKNIGLPRALRSDYAVLINNRLVIFYDIIKFEINK